MMIILSLVFLCVFTVATTANGWFVAQYTLKEQELSTLERGLTGFVVGALILFFLVWGIGTFTYTPTSMWVLFSIWSAVSVIPVIRWWQVAGKRLCSTLATECLRFPNIWGYGLFGGLMFVSVISGLAPPADFDGLHYHLTMPKRDLEAGQILNVLNDRLFDSFPALIEMLYRLVLATVGETALHTIHGLFGLVAALGTYCLTCRLGGQKSAALIAAIMYLSIRLVVWGVGTSHNDLGLSAYFVLALIVYMQWRKHGGIRLMVLFGILIGGLCNVKYHGMALAGSFAPLFLYDWLVQRRKVGEIFAGTGMAILLFLPLTIRNFVFYGNPIAPLLGSYFPNTDPSHILFPPKTDATLIERIIDLFRAPWDMFILGSYYADGQIYGAPYLLVFIPLAFFVWRQLRTPWVPWVSGIVYFVTFSIAMPQVNRFMIPLFPILAAYAGLGAYHLFQNLLQNRFYKALCMCACVILAINQSLFVGIYAAMRLPVVIGLIDKEAYLTKIPTMKGNHYPICQFVTKTLKPQERYLSLPNLRSYYCPQTPAIHDIFDDERIKGPKTPKPFPALTARQYIDRIESENIRLIVIPTVESFVYGPAAKRKDVQQDISGHRFGALITPLLSELTPAFTGLNAAAYWGEDVKQALLRKVEAQ